MHLNNLKSAWEQLKVINAIQPVESKEILSVIEKAANTQITRFRRIIFGLVMFILITVICQGG